jgi:hypothetical protein
VIVPGFGLLAPDTKLDPDQWRFVGQVDVHEENSAYSVPLIRDAEQLRQAAGPDCRVLLLGSIATAKYTQPLLPIFGERLMFPEQFTGRGDMSRGGLMLRCVQSGEELTYVGIKGAARRGSRPAKLEPLQKRAPLI